MSNKSKSRKFQQKPSAAIGPEQATQQDKVVIPGGVRLPDVPKNAAQSNNGGQEAVIWKVLKRIGLAAGILYAMVTLLMYLAMLDANKQNRESFEISEQPDVVVGRKDGVMAEIKDATDPSGQPEIVLYLQNAGKLPATNVCISTFIKPDPSILQEPPPKWNPLQRTQGTKGIQRFSVGQTGCPTIPAESVYQHVITDRTLTQQVMSQIKAAKDKSFGVDATIQWCSPFGKYSCRNVFLDYNHDLIGSFSEQADRQCGAYELYPPRSPIAEGAKLLPPCPTPKEEEDNQKELLKFLKVNPTGK